MTVRLSKSSLTGTARTLVAVGTVRLVSMFWTVRAAAPRSVTFSTVPGSPAFFSGWGGSESASFLAVSESGFTGSLFAAGAAVSFFGSGSAFLRRLGLRARPSRPVRPSAVPARRFFSGWARAGRGRRRSGLPLSDGTLPFSKNVTQEASTDVGSSW